MATGSSGVQRLRTPTSGELRDLVTFQRQTEVDDGSGGFEYGWEDYARVYARVLPVSSFRIFLARQAEARVTHQVTIRYSVTSGQIKRGDRMILKDRTGERFLFVESVRDTGNMRQWTEIEAFEDRPGDEEA